MSVRILNIQFKGIVVLTAVLLLFGYSVLPLSKMGKSFDSTCYSTTHSILTFDQSSDPHHAKSLSSKINCSLINHCAVCGAIVSSYAINLDRQINFTHFLSFKFIANDNEFIPELRPPRIA